MRVPRCGPCITWRHRAAYPEARPTTMSRFFSSAFVLKGVNELLL